MFPLQTLTREPAPPEGPVLRNFLANLLLIAVSFALCLLVAEGAIRIIDGQSVVALALPEVNSSQGVDTTGGHLDEMPRAASVDRALFFSDPPPLPNRTVPPQEWTDMYHRIQANQAGVNPFLPWDMYKAWNSVFVGDPCTHSYLKGAPGQLYVYDPPDGKPRPFFRFLPNATSPDGLVTNAFGWRGPPVQFQRAPQHDPHRLRRRLDRGGNPSDAVLGTGVSARPGSIAGRRRARST